MPLFPLDAIRNATIDRDLELVLEDVREEVARFSFPAELGGTDAVVEAYDAARPRLNVLLALLEDQVGKTGADISTGLGFLPVLLKRRYVRVTATEQETDVSAFAREEGIEIRQYRIGRDSPPFPPASLDFLVFAEVLEHLRAAPVPVLRELTGLLRPGGRLILTTPNIARLDHLEALMSGENFLEPFDDDLPLDRDATETIEHVREYSIREVIEAVETVGLVVEQVLMTGWAEDGYHPLPNPYVNQICVLRASK